MPGHSTRGGTSGSTRGRARVPPDLSTISSLYFLVTPAMITGPPPRNTFSYFLRLVHTFSDFLLSQAFYRLCFLLSRAVYFLYFLVSLLSTFSTFYCL